MQPNQLFHYSVATLKLQPLLRNKLICEKIIHNLHLLTNAKQIKVYGYAILPNRLELLWELTNSDENESPHVQFLKLSSFDFLKVLRKTNKRLLDMFCIDMLFHKIQFWQKTQTPVKVKSEQQAATILKNMHHAAKKYQSDKQGDYSSEDFYNYHIQSTNLVVDYRDYFAKKMEEVH
jgi:hypothetical protein